MKARALFESYFPKGTCKVDATIDFASDVLKLAGLDYITRSYTDVTISQRTYTFVNIFNILMTIVNTLNGIRIGGDADLKLNSLMFFFLVSMVSISLVTLSTSRFNRVLAINFS